MLNKNKTETYKQIQNDLALFLKNRDMSHLEIYVSIGALPLI